MLMYVYLDKIGDAFRSEFYEALN